MANKISTVEIAKVPFLEGLSDAQRNEFLKKFTDNNPTSGAVKFTIESDGRVLQHHEMGKRGHLPSPEDARNALARLLNELLPTANLSESKPDELKNVLREKLARALQVRKEKGRIIPYEDIRIHAKEVDGLKTFDAVELELNTMRTRVSTEGVITIDVKTDEDKPSQTLIIKPSPAYRKKDSREEICRPHGIPDIEIHYDALGIFFIKKASEATEGTTIRSAPAHLGVHGGLRGKREDEEE